MTPSRVASPALLALFVCAFVSTAAPAQPAGPAAALPRGTAVTVSMDRPSTHYFHVQMRVDDVAGDSIEVKLPVWTPGYYLIMDYARNVLNFRAADTAGRALGWEKTAKNSWRVKAGKAPVVVDYDVYAYSPSVADSYLDDDRAFICPTGVFMHVAGRLQQPVTVIVKPYAGWRSVTTGLDPVAGAPGTFIASDVDVLYDSPILVGNQETVAFEVRGIPHVLAGKLDGLDRQAFVADLGRMIESAATLMGDIPYSRYAFMIIGPGGGGLEHLNSTALTFGGGAMTTRAAYVRWLTFVTHEYFHHYNVKRIRPIALGPFDYDRENYTNMLWVSEGFTVYYEDLVLNRAGLLDRKEVLQRAGETIARFENAPGHAFQSATESSYDTWIKFFTRTPNLATTTISYYDKGAALGLLLDLAIRHESGNQRSLDDVMRTLYRQFYKEKKRGFTDEEFRQVCERTAGAPLADLFEYASTVKDVDYAKYLAYAGLQIDVSSSPVKGAAWGAALQDQEGTTTVSSVEWDSPAAQAGLSVRDELLAFDGARVTARTLADSLASRKPGDRVKVLLSRAGKVKELEVTLAAPAGRTFAITPAANATAAQKAILDGWLRE
jgi:predicted metalloprotease with PDZ domain